MYWQVHFHRRPQLLFSSWRGILTPITGTIEHLITPNTPHRHSIPFVKCQFWGNSHAGFPFSPTFPLCTNRLETPSRWGEEGRPVFRQPDRWGEATSRPHADPHRTRSCFYINRLVVFVLPPWSTRHPVTSLCAWRRERRRDGGAREVKTRWGEIGSNGGGRGNIHNEKMIEEKVKLHEEELVGLSCVLFPLSV